MFKFGFVPCSSNSMVMTYDLPFVDSLVLVITPEPKLPPESVANALAKVHLVVVPQLGVIVMTCDIMYSRTDLLFETEILAAKSPPPGLVPTVDENAAPSNFEPLMVTTKA